MSAENEVPVAATIGPAAKAPEPAIQEPVDVINPEDAPKADAAPKDEAPKPEEQKPPVAEIPKDSQTAIDKRIGKAVAAQRAAERDRDYWRGIAEKTAPNTEDKKPTPDQFTDYDTYIEALSAHSAKQAISSAATETASRHMHAAEETIWESRLDETKHEIADFETVVGAADQVVTVHVRDAIKAAERGPELLYHLAKHPEIVIRLNAMPATRAAIELGRLEATLGTQVPKLPSNAPKPITPIAPMRNVAVTLENAEMDDYVALRRKQGARFVGHNP